MFLIDRTDARYFITANTDVMEFVRRSNPFCHSDVGTVLLALGKEIDGALAYSPSYGSCAYVVLHTQDNRIFGIGYGQHDLAFRIPEAMYPDALADGGTAAAEIGASWVAFPPFDVAGTVGARQRLRHWCAVAFRG